MGGYLRNIRWCVHLGSGPVWCHCGVCVWLGLEWGGQVVERRLFSHPNTVLQNFLRVLRVLRQFNCVLPSFIYAGYPTLSFYLLLPRSEYSEIWGELPRRTTWILHAIVCVCVFCRPQFWWIFLHNTRNMEFLIFTCEGLLFKSFLSAWRAGNCLESSLLEYSSFDFY